ncbi:hypothetical protein HFN65_31325 [Rhizobium laguerreae]|uniref:hypothetical protein n=1 Tax=Rhizobium laguerreae TaxID=1076926 RepID=UPI001C915C94|nr:hypothetical protein [Rhizobium laguerreae]MBY3575431.1 hypothetical protein [Rhizobium laguerreae]
MFRKLFFATGFIVLASSLGTANSAMTLKERVEERIEQTRQACLVDIEQEDKVAFSISAEMNKLLAKLSASGEKINKEVLEGVQSTDIAAANIAKESARKCYKDAGLYDFIRGALKPNIVFMDGNLISYQPDFDKTGENNRTVLTKALAGKLGEPTAIFHEQGISLNWNSWELVTSKVPDVVALHWSAFQVPSRGDPIEQVSCEPNRDNECAMNIVEILRTIWKHNARPTKFVIYSRNKWICGKQFRQGLRNILPDRKMVQDVFLFRVPSRSDGFNNSRTILALEGVLMHALGRDSFEFVADYEAGGKVRAEACVLG